jgi:predicted DNA-binding helix-hairpin-helix protein
MARLRLRIEEAKSERKGPRFAPAGQSTQMIVGADGASDAAILDAAATLYVSYGLRRIYYSAFSPIPAASPALPLQAPPLQREHRLYQADWLMRFYGFALEEILASATDGMLELAIDPKLAWALRHRERFPVDVNHADRDLLLRVPGLGRRTVGRILAARRQRTLRLDDLGRLAASVRKLRPFVVAADHRPTRDLDRLDLRALLIPPKQLSLFS